MFSACSLASLVLSVFLSQRSEFWICRHAPLYLGLQVCTLHLGLQVWTLMPRIISVYCYTWDYWHAPSYLELQACPLIPRIAGKHTHTWDYKCAPSHLGLQGCTLIPEVAGVHPHTWGYKGAPSSLGLQGYTLTPGITKVHPHTLDYKCAPSHLELQVCTITPGITGVGSHTWLPWYFFWGACRRFLFRSWVPTFTQQPSTLLEKYWAWHFSWPSAFCHLPSHLQGKSHMLSPAQLRGCRKLYENKSILYSRHAWCPCQAISFPGCRHQRSYAVFFPRAGLYCPHLFADIH